MSSRNSNLAVAPEPDTAVAADEAAPEPKQKKAKKPGRRKLMIILVTVLMVGGYAGYTFLGGGGGGTETELPPEPGAVIPLESITINLADGHFLKIRIALQATAEAVEAPDGSRALDLTISQFSNVPLGGLASTEGRDHAKEELREKIIEAYEGDVMDLYLTEFVMQ
jgi:flagellar FliL protein